LVNFRLDAGGQAGEDFGMNSFLLNIFRRAAAPGFAICLAACKSAPPLPEPPEPEPVVPEMEEPVAPVPVEIGRISVIGAGSAFVVINLHAGAEVPAPGTDLAAYYLGQDMARLRVSPERRGRLVTADVIRGRVDAGYEVRRVRD